MISVFSAAKHLATCSDWSLSNLELQKLLYLAHMFYLGRTDKPLVHGQFEAWAYGPVHPPLYHKVKVFGSSPVENIFHSYSDLSKGPEKEIISEVYDALGNSGSARLVSATHRKGGAWDLNYVPGMRHCIISNEDILTEYRGLEGG